MTRFAQNSPRLLLALSGVFVSLVAIVTSGCALRLPAIDKSGERIFEPAPNSTSLALAPCPLLAGLPEPAFTSPPVPPPCPPEFAAPAMDVPPAAAPPSRLFSTGHCKLNWFQKQTSGALAVTPSRIVAPVGSEVILTAGVVGERGELLKGEKIEWILAQNSTGHFLEVSEGSHPMFNRVLHRQPKKLSNDFAVGRTSSKPEHVTRGTPTPTDDTWVQSGQTWITLTSATAGTSSVTVQAPDIEGWDRRRQTATIHWLDAQWRLPSTAIVPAGQPHVLETEVLQATDGAPLAGWTVRYEIVGTDAAAGFAPTGGSVAESRTDNSGRAAVQIAPKGNQFGSTQVRIQIIRPGTGTGDIAQLVVGQGWTTVTWSAPGLTISVAGPKDAGINSTVTYQIHITNPGDMPARNVVIADAPTAGLQVVASQPPGTPFGDRREWRFGELSPKTSQVITVNCQCIGKGLQQYCVTGTGEGVQANSCAETLVVQPAIGLQMTGPDKALVGDEVEYRIEITNLGDQPLTNVTLSDQFDAGFVHVQGQPSPIQKVLDNALPPGETARIATQFKVARAGEICHTLDVSADGGHRAQARKCLTATDPAPVANPAVKVSISGPPQQRVGEVAHYVINVTNAGNVELRNVQVRFDFPPSLMPKNATDGHNWEQGGLVWSRFIPVLRPGEASKPINVYCECRAEAQAAEVGATATSDQNVSGAAKTQTNIIARVDDGNVRPDPPLVPPPAQPEVVGDLKVTLSKLKEPITVGGDGRYIVTITNDRNLSDRDVEVTIVVSPEMSITRVAPFPQGGRPVAVKDVGDNGRTWNLIPFNEVRSKEALTFAIETKGVAAGNAILFVKVKSLRSTPEIEVHVDTTVNP